MDPLRFFIKYKFRHCAIFPKGNPLSIVAATTFHNHVRDGMEWYNCAINTEIKSFKLNDA